MNIAQCFFVFLILLFSCLLYFTVFICVYVFLLFFAITSWWIKIYIKRLHRTASHKRVVLCFNVSKWASAASLIAHNTSFVETALYSSVYILFIVRWYTYTSSHIVINETRRPAVADKPALSTAESWNQNYGSRNVIGNTLHLKNGHLFIFEITL